MPSTEKYENCLLGGRLTYSTTSGYRGLEAGFSQAIAQKY